VRSIRHRTWQERATQRTESVCTYLDTAPTTECVATCHDTYIHYIHTHRGFRNIEILRAVSMLLLTIYANKIQIITTQTFIRLH
jgi:hypothetical protein